MEAPAGGKLPVKSQGARKDNTNTVFAIYCSKELQLF